MQLFVDPTMLTRTTFDFNISSCWI